MRLGIWAKDVTPGEVDSWAGEGEGRHREMFTSDHAHGEVRPFGFANIF